MTHLIVGSSPFQLVLGIHLLMARSRPDAGVLVVDAADRPGGAWCTGEVFGVRNIELGAHYVENDDHAYGVLERCGVGLAPMEPGPTVLVSRPVGNTIPDRVKNLALFGYGSLRRNRSFDRTRHDARITAVRSLRRVSPVPWRYHPLGCAGLVGDLVRRFTDLGGQLRLGQRVERMQEADDHVACVLGGGETVTADHVHVTNNTTGIRMDGLRAFDPPLRANVLVAVAGAPRRFSFVQVKGDAVIQVVTDIGRYAPTPQGTAIIAAQLRPGADDESGPGDVGFVIDRLRRLGLLARSDVVTDARIQRHPIAGAAGELAWRAATDSSERITARRPEVLYSSLAAFG